MAKKKFVPRPPEDPAVIEARWKKKKERIGELANGIRRLRHNVTLDLKSEDERTFLTALAIAIMDRTAERVGNDVSAKNGHHGVTNFRKKHIKIDGNQITLQYVGKSGVSHDKKITDSILVGHLQKAISNSPNQYVFCTSDKFRIKADRVNRRLHEFGVTAKDLRGYSANRWVSDKLSKVTPEETENKRKRQFNKILREVAKKIGHGSGTLKKHYLIPEMPDEFILHSRVVNIKELGYYKEGGEIEKPEDSEAEFDWAEVFKPESESEIAERSKKRQEEEERQLENRYQESKFSKKWAPTRKIAIDKLIDQYKNAEINKRDWESRSYKTSNKTAEVGKHDDYEYREISVDHINALRRRRKVEFFKSEMQDAINDLKQIGLSSDEISQLIGSDIEKMELGGIVGRFKPLQAVTFNPAIIGQNGAKLLSYEWAYKWEEDWSQHKNEPVAKRKSDWEHAEQNIETGRDIVHKFEVQLPDGTIKKVSAETVPVVLGYSTLELKKFPSLVIALKTLAKQQMQLHVMQSKQNEYERALSEVEKMEKPPILEKEYKPDQHGGITIYAMGDEMVWQSDVFSHMDKTSGMPVYKKLDSIEPERKSALTDSWIRRRLQEQGVSRQYGIQDMKNRIRRQEQKISQISGASIQTKQTGGELQGSNVMAENDYLFDVTYYDPNGQLKSAGIFSDPDEAISTKYELKNKGYYGVAIQYTFEKGGSVAK